MKQFFLYIALIIFPVISFSQKVVFEKLEASVDPDSSMLRVSAEIHVTPAKEIYFSLNRSLILSSVSENAGIKKVQSAKAADVGMDRDIGSDAIETNLYRVKLKRGDSVFTITYHGKVDSALRQSGENYQRSFSESPGIICDSGVYLAGSTYWTPAFKNTLVTFDLKVVLPEGWKSVSQGERVKSEEASAKHTDQWKCLKPQEEVFLIAAPFSEYSYTMNSGVQAMAFLRQPDEGLANKYLEVTEQYMEMYNELIGPYPYSKFALVENFWETGYGMPSFTLLGEQIIRFPFILHSSYPHELLHNWWGNSVYVDFDSGNWCEGITAYMADHLIKEQRGQGEEYRRSTLKKYTDFVTPENDFPLSRFLARHDAASEAVGYGKALMVWHMLRRMLGDETFVKGWQNFYRQYRYKVASFGDIRSTFEQTGGVNLKPFFHQWIERTGAPTLAIASVSFDRFNDQYRLFLTLEQTQKDSLFVVDVPVVVATAKGLHSFVVRLDQKRQDFQLFLGEKPLKLAVDPQFDVFRRVDPREVPPALSKIWASKENVIILPAKADKLKKEVYLAFADQWQKNDRDHFEVVYDQQLTALPKDKTPWIIGLENKFVDSLNVLLQPYHSYLNADTVKLGDKLIPSADNSLVVTVFNPGDADKSYLFVQPGNMDAVAGLVRKLPHYGKYSYLAFKGDEPTNFVKGLWPVTGSPLVYLFDTSAASLSMKTERRALAYVKPVFSEKRMMQHIRFLASEAMKGRGLGTPELDTAARYIADRFSDYGLQPLGKDYFQTFTKHFPDKPGEKDLTLKNVVAYIPGSDPALKEEPVIVSAHYDHLGLGWPDAHAGDKGKIHYGADDNASGVSILLELAKNMAKMKPKRPVVFVAFTGEEAGLVGSRYFVQHFDEYFKGKPFADINLDTDGSLFDKKILVLNGNTAREWKFIFMGTDYTTGIKSEVLTTDLDASDQVAFIDKGIPAVQLFTGATENYHRPSDTWDKIDSAGLVKVATVAKEVIAYLADRTEPMPFTGKAGTGKPAAVPSKANSGKRASTGSVPDFTFSGEGVKIGSVIQGSAGDKAGLKAGDVIVAVNDEPVTGLKNYTVVLKRFKPGDKAVFTIVRDGKKIKIPLVFGER